MQGIYRIRNKLDDKRYIGSAQDFENGWIGRRRALRRGKHHNIRLQRAWNKHGEENFIFEVEEEVDDEEAPFEGRLKDAGEGAASNAALSLAKER